ncbi:MAG: cation diffusion facilitator family transporter, partial [Leifsonia sp.]
MAHDHAHQTSNRFRLLIVIGIVFVVLVVEVVGAWLSGSLALLADAGHMLSDLTGLVVALIAAIVAARPASERQTYGYQRAEVFGALINALILIVVAVFVTVEAVQRLLDPGDGEVQGGLMLVVAGIGLVANIIALLVLRTGDTASLNMRGAALEVLG